jgi:hypothetical protein
MRTSASPVFDHGAAIRVPPAHDGKAWRMLMIWLGDHGRRLDRPGLVEVTTPVGQSSAAPGDWIVLSVSGAYHVAKSSQRAGDL